MHGQLKTALPGHPNQNGTFQTNDTRLLQFRQVKDFQKDAQRQFPPPKKTPLNGYNHRVEQSAQKKLNFKAIIPANKWRFSNFCLLSDITEQTV